MNDIETSDPPRHPAAGRHGEVWSARAYVPVPVIQAGAVVDVFEIRGASALVYAEETTT